MLNTRFANGVLALLLVFCLINACLLLIESNLWISLLPIKAYAQAPNSIYAFFLSTAYFCFSLYSFLALRRRSLRKWILPALTLFFCALPVLLIANSTNVTIAEYLWFIVPALLLIILWLPYRAKKISNDKENGHVKWFHAKKGYGFISRPDGEDLFVHYRGINGQGHRVLKEGQLVEYFVVKGPRGLQAKDVEMIGDDID